MTSLGTFLSTLDHFWSLNVAKLLGSLSNSLAVENLLVADGDT